MDISSEKLSPDESVNRQFSSPSPNLELNEKTSQLELLEDKKNTYKQGAPKPLGLLKHYYSSSKEI